jgi:uncharacterized membrane protein YbaN (DUF454 family)
MSTTTLPSVRYAPELNEDAERLRSMAAGMLRRPGVRAVVIDRRRLRATIVPQNGATAEETLATIETLLATVDDDAAGEVIDWHDSRGETLYCVRAGRLATGWRRAALVSMTIFVLLLALAGVLLPGLPTTPFVLLASYGLMRTSRRWHRRLLDSRLFGGVLRDWHLHRGISAHIRVKALALLTIVVAATCFWPGTAPAVKAFVVIGGLLGGAYVWRLPTATRTGSVG